MGARPIEKTSPSIGDARSKGERYGYDWMLWYKITDSASPNGSTEDGGGDPSEAKALEDVLDSGLHRLCEQAGREGGGVHCQGSADGSMHVFVRGKKAWSHVCNLSRLLAGVAALWPTFRVRACLVPCDFVDTQAYRGTEDEEVRGEAFWTHWRQLLAACSKLETQCHREHLQLLVVADKAIRSFKGPYRTQWTVSHTEVVTTRGSDELVKSTPVCFGELTVMEPQVGVAESIPGRGQVEEPAGRSETAGAGTRAAKPRATRHNQPYSSLPAQPIAFVCCAPAHSGEALARLVGGLVREVGVRTGYKFLVVSREDEAWAQSWMKRVEGPGLEGTTFMLAIITPALFKDRQCRADLEMFLGREKEARRNDLVIPIHYVDCPLLLERPPIGPDPLAQIVTERPQVDWRDLRQEPELSNRVQEGIREVAKRIAGILVMV